VKIPDIPRIWSLLRKQVKELRIPWIEQIASTGRDPFRVLVSCLLSLRTQDRTTAMASDRLFSLASTPEGIASLGLKEIQRAIYPVGFYRVKAERISALSKTLVERYHGGVPDTIDELLKLRGVGRKTANLVITLGYGRYGICVDTHVHRIVNRWGYVKTRNPGETEFALREKLPKKYWREINGLLVAFGQHICKPVSPLCSRCDLEDFCAKVNVTRHR
jgi:endonuclease III